MHADHPHDYRPTFSHPGCVRCGRRRGHRVHQPGPPPTLHCPACDRDVPLPDMHRHLNEHGIWACGGDPWNLTQGTVVQLMRALEQMSRRRPENDA